VFYRNVLSYNSCFKGLDVNITLWGLSFEVKVSLPYHVCFIEMYYHIIVVSKVPSISCVFYRNVLSYNSCFKGLDVNMIIVVSKVWMSI
jgi:hypothetical protein